MRYFGLLAFSLFFLYSSLSCGSGVIVGNVFAQFEINKQGVTLYSIENPEEPQIVAQHLDIEPKFFRQHGSRLYLYSQKSSTIYAIDTSSLQRLDVPLKESLLDFLFYEDKLIMFFCNQGMLIYETINYTRLSKVMLDFLPRLFQLLGDKIVLASSRNKIAVVDLATTQVSYSSLPLDIERMASNETFIAFNFVNDCHLAFFDPLTKATRFFEFDSKIRHLKLLEGKCFVFVSEHNQKKHVEIFDLATETFSEDVISECAHPMNLLSNGTYLFVLVEEKESLYILEKDSFDTVECVRLRNVRSVAVDQERIVAESMSGNFKVLKIADYVNKKLE